MSALNYPDPSASPWTDPNGVVWEHNGIGWRKQSVSSIEHADTLNRDAVDSHPAAAISGLSLPNMLFNADFLILDHGGGDRTPGINVYGFNRWRGSVLGLKQTVFGVSITSGNYTLSWGGGSGNGSLNGVAGISGITTVLAADVNAEVEVPADATWARLERGDDVSPHVRRDIGEDTLKCQRFHWRMGSSGVNSIGVGQVFNDTLAGYYIQFPVTMRTLPAFSSEGTFTATTTNGGALSVTSTDMTKSSSIGARVEFTVASGLVAGAASLGVQNANSYLIFDAEIYD